MYYASITDTLDRFYTLGPFLTYAEAVWAVNMEGDHVEVSSIYTAEPKEFLTNKESMI